LNEARQWLVKKTTSISGKIGRKHRTYCRKARQEYLLFNKRKRKRREYNRIEGAIGNIKNHYGLDRIRYSIESGDELWVRLGLLAANLKTAASKA